jgi:hypothetical protein
MADGTNTTTETEATGESTEATTETQGTETEADGAHQPRGSRPDPRRAGERPTSRPRLHVSSSRQLTTLSCPKLRRRSVMLPKPLSVRTSSNATNLLKRWPSPKGVPAKWVARLVGDTEEEIRADARVDPR